MTPKEPYSLRCGICRNRKQKHRDNWVPCRSHNAGGEYKNTSNGNTVRWFKLRRQKA